MSKAELKALRGLVEARGCPMTVIKGKRVVEGDLCRGCQWRPASAEYSRSDCWAVWRSQLAGLTKAAEEEHHTQP